MEGYREEGLSVPRKDKVCREEGGCTMVLLRPPYGLRVTETELLQRADVDTKQGRIASHRLKGVNHGIKSREAGCYKNDCSYQRTRLVG